MIWRKIKTHWLLSGLFLLFACSFCGSLSSHSVFADQQLIFDRGTFTYGSNYISGPWTLTHNQPYFTGEHNWDNILDINNNVVVGDPHLLYIQRYQGVSKGGVETSNFNADGEFGTFHLEFNVVAMSINPYGAYHSWIYNQPGNIVINGCSDGAGTQLFPVESSSVSVALTPWYWLDVPTYHADLENETLTIIADLVVRFPANYNGDVYCQYGLNNNSFIYPRNAPNDSFYLYYESGSGTVSFTDDRDLALLQAQNNILNRQLALQEQQAQQDAQDRSNIQNRSSDATTDGDNASTNAQTATSSLLSAITGIYNQLLHPSITSCRVFGVQVYELNLGTLDFCTGFDMPPALMAIGSIGMIGLVLLLGWSVLHATISLYNDLFGGKK